MFYTFYGICYDKTVTNRTLKESRSDYVSGEKELNVNLLDKIKRLKD